MCSFKSRRLRNLWGSRKCRIVNLALSWAFRGPRRALQLPSFCFRERGLCAFRASASKEPSRFRRHIQTWYIAEADRLGRSGGTVDGRLLQGSGAEARLADQLFGGRIHAFECICFSQYLLARETLFIRSYHLAQARALRYLGQTGSEIGARTRRRVVLA